MAIKVLQKTDSVTGYTFKNLHSDDAAVNGESVQGIKLLLGAAGVSEGFVGSSNALPVGWKMLYSSTPGSYTNGQSASPRMGQSGGMLVELAGQQGGNDTANQVTGTGLKPHAGTAYAATIYESPSNLPISGIIKNQSGAIQSLTLRNNKATGYWVQIHNSPDVPTASASRHISFWLAAGTSSSAPFVKELTPENFGGVLNLSLGISFTISTDKRTFTQSGLAAGDFDMTAMIW